MTLKSLHEHNLRIIPIHGITPSIVNVTVITVMSALSAAGSIMVPKSVRMLYFLAIYPSSLLKLVAIEINDGLCYHIGEPCQGKQSQSHIIIAFEY